MENEALKQLKRVFGADAVFEITDEDSSGRIYQIRFPRAQSAEGAEIDNVSNMPANQAVSFVLQKWLPAGTIEYYSTQTSGIIDITNRGASHSAFIQKLQSLEDGIFLPFMGEDITATEKLSTRILKKLNGMHESTQWKISNDSGEPVFMTTSKVKKPRAVAYYVTDVLAIDSEASHRLISLLSADAGIVAIPARLIGEHNIDRIDNINAKKLEDMLTSVQLDGPG